MPGLAPADLMHEWIAADTPSMDIEPERITAELCRDNETMLELIRELGAEPELRRRIMAQQKLTD